MWGVRQDTQAFSPQACEPVLCGSGRTLPLLDTLLNCGGMQRRDGSLLCAATGRAVISDDNLRIERVVGGGTARRVRSDFARRSGALGNLSAPVDKDNGTTAKTLRALQWCCVWPRSFIAGLAAAICVFSGASAAAEGCLSTEVSLSNWQEKDAGQIDRQAGSARCWQSRTNSGLEMCLERTGEPKACKLEIRFQGKRTDFPVDDSHDLAISENMYSDNRYDFGCDVIRTRIMTEWEISSDERIEITEDTQVPENSICINGIGEVVGFREISSILIGSHLVQVSYTRLDLDYKPEAGGDK